MLNTFDTAIILNQQSLDKFESKIRPGGILVYDPQGISRKPTRTDISIYTVKAMDAATEMDNVKAFNMIVLGAYLKVQPIVSLDSVMTGLKKSLPDRHHKLLPMNQAALVKGGELVEVAL